jgi:hypothetical protein
MFHRDYHQTNLFVCFVYQNNFLLLLDFINVAFGIEFHTQQFINSHKDLLISPWAVSIGSRDSSSD